MSICQVHLGIDRAGYGEVDIDIWLGWDILEIDGGVVFVFRFGKVECELVVDCEIIKAAGVDWVSKVVVLGVALLAMVSGNTLISSKQMHWCGVFRDKSLIRAAFSRKGVTDRIE